MTDPETAISLIERFEKLGPVGLVVATFVLCLAAFLFVARRWWGRVDEAEKKADDIADARLADREKWYDLAAKVEGVLRDQVASNSQRAQAWDNAQKVIENSGRILQGIEHKWAAGETRLLNMEHRLDTMAGTLERIERILERRTR